MPPFIPPFGAKQVLLWSYPDTQRQPISLETQHQANIFGVRFLPQSNDARLVTGAMDYTVQVSRLWFLVWGVCMRECLHSKVSRE